MECARCGTVDDVRPRPSYYFDEQLGSPDDPVCDIDLCDQCAEEHAALWCKRLQEYWSAVI